MLKAFEKLFAMAMLAYGCGAFALLLLGPISDVEKLAPRMSTPALIAQLGFHGFAAFFYILHAKKLTLAIARTPLWAALALFAVCSASWSQDPSLSFRRGLILIGTVLFGLYFGSRFELKEQIDILAWTFLLIVITSAAVAIAVPRLGVESGHHFSDWRGLFIQKNYLARIDVLAILVFTFWRPSYRPLRYFAIGFAIMLLPMTRSATALVVLTALLIVKQLFGLIRTQAKLIIPMAILVLMAGVALGTVLVTNSGAALALLGRNSTLTGRTELWHECLVSIMKRPLLGYGFDAFWRGMSGESARVISASHWLVGYAHNGILELWLNLGALGLALFLLAYALYLMKSVRFYLRHDSHLSAWPLAYLAFIFFYNLTEVTELEQNNIFTVLMAALAATVTLRAFEMEPEDDEYISTAAFEAEPIYIS
jgi:exopolysaccharide production protein ExoQ